jgi:Ca-activated chloride channel family protein
MQKDLYGILGLNKGASHDQIRRAYKEAARTYHPDVNVAPGDTEFFLLAQEAFEVLSDSSRRAEYDASLPAEAAPAPGEVAVQVQMSRSALNCLDEPQVIYTMATFSPGMVDQALEDRPAALSLNVCLVIDRSTSMQGERMDMVKAAAIDLIGQLSAADSLSIVVFGDKAEVLVNSGRQASVEDSVTAIRMLRTGGGTEIYKGLQTAFNEVKRNRNKKHSNHIILITDGRTYGDEEACLELAREAAAAGVGMSALGIGSGWNDTFLDDLTGLTGGSCRYIDKIQDLKVILQEKISGLGNAFAEHLTLSLQPAPYVIVKDVFRLQPEPAPISGCPLYHLGSIPRSGPLSILVEFLIAPVRQCASEPNEEMLVAKGEITYQMTGPSGNAQHAPITFSLLVTDTAILDCPPQTVLDAVSRVTFYKMQERARQEAAAGFLDKAKQTLHQLATNVLAQGNRDFAQVIFEEADYLYQTKAFRVEGEKRIKYGTRSLLLPPGADNINA